MSIVKQQHRPIVPIKGIQHPLILGAIESKLPSKQVSFALFGIGNPIKKIGYALLSNKFDAHNFSETICQRLTLFECFSERYIKVCLADGHIWSQQFKRSSIVAT